MKRCSIGGQAVMEGVMMRSPEGKIAMAVRRQDGGMELFSQDAPQKQRPRILKWPVVRGVVNFGSMMAMGVRMLSRSASMAGFEEEAEKPSKFEEFLAKKTGKSADSIMVGMAVFMAVVLAVALFFLLPSFITGLFRPLSLAPVVMNLIEGAVRILIFLGYVLAVSLLKDIRRTFMYHGAEHKVIACYEHEMPLDVEHARTCSTKHPRCGTNYLLLVMVISILVFSLTGFSGGYLARTGLRILLLPLVAGIAYEVLKLVGKSDSLPARIVRAPGMALQKLTTREPDDSMLEVSLTAFKKVLGYKDDEIPEYVKSLPRQDAETLGGQEPEDGADSGDGLAAEEVCAVVDAAAMVSMGANE
jgi:uncharacterized protein YqhQ